MSKRQWLCILGVWVMVFLFTGITTPWHKVVAIVTGLIIITIAYNLPQERKTFSSKDSGFVENNPQ